MIRKAFVLQVNPDKHNEYEKRHNPIWAEMEAALKEGGAHNYSIFLNPETSQLFGYVEIEEEERWNNIANTDACRRWWKHMSDIMPSEADGRPLSSSLTEVFHLK